MEGVERERPVVKAVRCASPLRHEQERVGVLARRTLDGCLLVRRQQEWERVQNALRQICSKTRARDKVNDTLYIPVGVGLVGCSRTVTHAIHTAEMHDAFSEHGSLDGPYTSIHPGGSGRHVRSCGRTMTHAIHTVERGCVRG